ncbi:hypothetical protein [Pedobacter aquatilis]|uniref:hypothetical protein n=1 Tax=Pedobacter aquatilis TaxID=351343 RepID=UPI00292F9C4F|nr:hypothetical protein [Pedobacter aquatilis]
MKDEYKTSEEVDMENLEAVKFAADEIGLSIYQYRTCVEKSGTRNRKAIEEFIRKRFDYKLGCC